MVYFRRTSFQLVGVVVEVILILQLVTSSSQGTQYGNLTDSDSESDGSLEENGEVGLAGDKRPDSEKQNILVSVAAHNQPEPKATTPGNLEKDAESKPNTTSKNKKANESFNQINETPDKDKTKAKAKVKVSDKNETKKRTSKTKSKARHGHGSSTSRPAVKISAKTKSTRKPKNLKASSSSSSSSRSTSMPNSESGSKPSDTDTSDRPTKSKSAKHKPSDMPKIKDTSKHSNSKYPVKTDKPSQTIPIHDTHQHVTHSPRQRHTRHDHSSHRHSHRPTRPQRLHSQTHRHSHRHGKHHHTKGWHHEHHHVTNHTLLMRLLERQNLDKDTWILAIMVATCITCFVSGALVVCICKERKSLKEQHKLKVSGRERLVGMAPVLPPDDWLTATRRVALRYCCCCQRPDRAAPLREHVTYEPLQQRHLMKDITRGIPVNRQLTQSWVDAIEKERRKSVAADWMTPEVAGVTSQVAGVTSQVTGLRRPIAQSQWSMGTRDYSYGVRSPRRVRSQRKSLSHIKPSDFSGYNMGKKLSLISDHSRGHGSPIKDLAKTEAQGSHVNSPQDPSSILDFDKYRAGKSSNHSRGHGSPMKDLAKTEAQGSHVNSPQHPSSILDFDEYSAGKSSVEIRNQNFVPDWGNSSANFPSDVILNLHQSMSPH